MMRISFAFLFSFLVLLPINGFANPVKVDPSTHPVVKYLNDNGIEVEVFYTNKPTLPGEPTFKEKLAKFWTTLELVQDEIVDRAENIETLTISEYTKARIEQKRLTIDVNHNETTVMRYFDSFDKKHELLSKISLALDTGIDLFRVRDKDFEELEGALNFWTQNIGKLNTISSIIGEIEVDSSFNTIYLEFGKIKLSKETYSTAFDSFYKQLEKAAKVFSAKLTSIDLELKFDLDRPDQKKKFEDLVTLLDKNLSNFSFILGSNLLEEISFAYFDDENNYHRTLKKLGLASFGDGLKDLPAVLSSVASELKIAADLGVKIQTFNDKLDEDYLKSIDHLKKFEAKVAAKKQKIESIYITYYSESKYQNKTLYINNDDSDSKVTQVIDGI